jgi:hypothetical protein
LVLTGFSVGCYGYGDFKNSLPQGQYNGVNYPPLKECVHMLDYVNIMSYDAGTSFDAIEAFKSYRSIYSGPINLGIETGTQAWGGDIITDSEVKQWWEFLRKESSKNGLFVWSYQKDGKEECMRILRLVK